VSISDFKSNPSLPKNTKLAYYGLHNIGIIKEKLNKAIIGRF